MERIKGVYRAKDFSDELQSEYIHGIPAGLDTGLSGLSGRYTIKPQQWTVVSGMPSSGKSTVVDNIMVSMATLHDWKFLVCSPENQPIHRHVESLIEIYSGKKYVNPNSHFVSSQAITPQEFGEAMLFVNSHFQFIRPAETDFNIDYILKLAGDVKSEFDYQGFLIDPYNQLQHKRPAGFTETEYISSLLSKYTAFIQLNNLHGWFVAHPTKQNAVTKVGGDTDLKARKLYQRTSLYDIAGGAHWYNKCDMGVIVYRNAHLKPETTSFCVDKVRFRECGQISETDFYYDYLCNRIVENLSDLLYARTS